MKDLLILYNKEIIYFIINMYIYTHIYKFTQLTVKKRHFFLLHAIFIISIVVVNRNTLSTYLKLVKMLDMREKF